MKKIIMLSIILSAMQDCFAQGNKSAYIEFGGNGIGISANFDSRFSKSEKGLGFRAGIGVLPGISATDLSSGQTDITTPAMLVIPIGINHLAGKAPHYFESGIGADYVNFSGKYSFFGSDVGIKGGTVLFVPSIGYRYAKTGKAFQGRIFLSPLIGSGGIIPWVGFSAGYK